MGEFAGCTARTEACAGWSTPGWLTEHSPANTHNYRSAYGRLRYSSDTCTRLNFSTRSLAAPKFVSRGYSNLFKLCPVRLDDLEYVLKYIGPSSLLGGIPLGSVTAQTRTCCARHTYLEVLIRLVFLLWPRLEVRPLVVHVDQGRWLTGIFRIWTLSGDFGSPLVGATIETCDFHLWKHDWDRGVVTTPPTWKGSQHFHKLCFIDRPREWLGA